MKKLLMLFAVLPFLFSCQNSGFDLDKTSFPINVEPLKSKYKIKENRDFGDMVLYYTTDENLLSFDGYNFSGTTDDPGKLQNALEFYKENKTNNVDAYKIRITTTNESEEFEELITKKFGKTDFYYKEPGMSFRIWYFKDKTYFLETNDTGESFGVKFKSCDLAVVNSNSKFFMDYYCSGGFQYFGDYLNEKNKPEHKGQKFTYRDFVNMEEKEDGADSFFVRNYVKE